MEEARDSKCEKGQENEYFLFLPPTNERSINQRTRKRTLETTPTYHLRSEQATHDNSHECNGKAIIISQGCPVERSRDHFEADKQLTPFLQPRRYCYKPAQTNHCQYFHQRERHSHKLLSFPTCRPHRYLLWHSLSPSSSVCLTQWVRHNLIFRTRPRGSHRSRVSLKSISYTHPRVGSFESVDYSGCCHPVC